MENFRLTVRGGINAVLMYLAIIGVSLQVALRNDADLQVKITIIIFNLVIGLLLGIVSWFVIRYFRFQQRTIDTISGELGLTVDPTVGYTVKTAVVLQVGLVVTIIIWLYFLVSAV